MTNVQNNEKPARRVPSAAERRIAARIRVRTDRALKLETPQWITDLAEATGPQTERRRR